MMKSLVAFDLDDTLVPEVLFLKSGIHYIAQCLSDENPYISAQRVISCMEAAVENRRNHYSALEALLDELKLRDSVDMKEIVAGFRNHVPNPEIYHLSPGRAALLSHLKKMGVQLALVTDGRSVTQRNKIVAAGIDAYIDYSNILISEETGYDKTYPDNFIALMHKFAGIEEFHYVADNPQKDFLHPKKLGWHTHLVHPFPLAIHQGMPK